MGKKSVLDGIYIRVDVSALNLLSSNYERGMRNRASEMADAIKLHLSREFPETRTVEIVEEIDAVCEHCERGWTEDDPNYNGGCCNKDVEAEDARKVES